MDAKHQKVRRRICLSSEENENYKSDIRDETDLEKVYDNKNLLQLWERRSEKATSNDITKYNYINTRI